MGCGSSNMASRETAGAFHVRRTSSASSSSSGKSTREDHVDQFQTPEDYRNPGDLQNQNYTVHEEYNAESVVENYGGNEEHFSETGGVDE